MTKSAHDEQHRLTPPQRGTESDSTFPIFIIARHAVSHFFTSRAAFSLWLEVSPVPAEMIVFFLGGQE